MSKKISIILCTYNEVNHVVETINLINKTLENPEIIIIDDNSTDGTLKKLYDLKTKLNFKLFVRENERGLASAQKKGFKEATGDFIGTIDANNKDQILYFNSLIKKLNDGYDIAFLSRYVVGGKDERVFLRSFGSMLINKVSKTLLRIPFTDFSSGIFLMKKDLINELEIIITGYSEWFIEFIYVMHKKGFEIVEIPYVQKKDDILIQSKSYPNFFSFIYLGLKYFFRVLITIIRN